MTTEQKIIKTKLGLLELGRQLGNVSEACRVMGYSRDSLETMKKRLLALEAKVAQEGGVLTEAQIAALEDRQREKEAYGEFESECPGGRRSQ